MNSAADGSSIRQDDPAAAETQWELKYTCLSDDELSALASFFAAMEGSLNGFTFLDPAGNLLAWSEDLANTAWNRDPFLSFTGSAADPLGGTSAFHLNNSGAGPQGLAQTLNVPGVYTYAFSVYARSAGSSTISLAAGERTLTAPLTAAWQRIWVIGNGAPAASTVAFQMTIPGGAAVDIFGPQAEAQRQPSAYKKSGIGGVFEDARFRDDAFTYTTTDVNRHSASLTIVYANHL